MSGIADRNVGILAIQGDYPRHEHQLKLLGVSTVLVRLPRDLEKIDSIILPGGESTTMDIMIDRFELRQKLTEFIQAHPCYATCAGMILLAKGIADNQAGVKPLGLLDVDLVRNGYGRQIFSFEYELATSLGNGTRTLAATFIRAPRISRLGKDVQILAKYGHEPVLVRQMNILAASFHTELDDDTTLLEFFLNEIN